MKIPEELKTELEEMVLLSQELFIATKPTDPQFISMTILVNAFSYLLDYIKSLPEPESSG